MLTFDRQHKRSLVQQISAMLTFDQQISAMLTLEQQNSAMLTLVQQNGGMLTFDQQNNAMLTFDQQNSMVGSSDPKRKRKVDTMVLLPLFTSQDLLYTISFQVITQSNQS